MSDSKETSLALRGAISGFVVAEDPDRLERTRLAVEKAGVVLKEKARVAGDTLRNVHSNVAKNPSLLTLSGFIGLLGLMIRKPAALSAPLPQRVSRSRMLMLALCGLAFLAAVFLPERAVKPSPGLPGVDSQEDIVAQPVTFQVPEPARRLHVTPIRENPVTPAAPEPVLALRDELQPHWQPVRRPIPIYHLEAPDVETSELDYQVFSRGRTARQDRLRWTPRTGGEGARGRITLVIERFETAGMTERPLLADMAQRAAEQHFSIQRLGQPTEIATKFGPMQVADGAFSGEDGTASCTVFRRIDMGGVTLAGWYCPPTGRPLDRVRLACFLNRLNLMSAGNDQGLRAFFTKADLNRLTCASSKQAGRKTTWMDHEAPMPPLKLSGKTR